MGLHSLVYCSHRNPGELRDYDWYRVGDRVGGFGANLLPLHRRKLEAIRRTQGDWP